MNIKVLASGSTGNCYRISDGKTTLLLDAGIPIKNIQIGCEFKLTSIDGCLITHAHGDHCKAAKDLIKYGIDIYTSQGTIDTCCLLGHRVHAVKSLERFTLGTFEIMPFDVEHDVVEPLGFLVSSKLTGEKLLYFTDTYYIKYTFKGLTHIMAECNYDSGILYENIMRGAIPSVLAPRIIKSHMSLDNLLELLKANDLSMVQQIYLLHLSSNNSDEKSFREKVQRLTGTEVYIC